MVYRTIRGTATTEGDSVDPSVIADKHWDLYESRAETRAVVQ
jgi:hypothetical protein